jgi:protein-S-isoprenylcysteine O-methyltransferase Ste14
MTTTQMSNTTNAANTTTVGRVASVVYGAVAYTIFVLTFLYAAGFVGNVLVPKTIDSGSPGDFWPSLLINAALLSLFAVQHSVMARPWFKQRWTKIVPASVERSTFVLASSLVLILTFWQWRPMPQAVWDVEMPAARIFVEVLSFAGFGFALAATWMIHHFDLFGLRQVYVHYKGREYTRLGFRTPGMYRYIRHPIMLGFLIGFWATPTMTAGHLLFSVLVTGYIAVGVMLEERDLIRVHGRKYEEYRETVPAILPVRKPAAMDQKAAVSGA